MRGKIIINFIILNMPFNTPLNIRNIIKVFRFKGCPKIEDSSIVVICGNEVLNATSIIKFGIKKAKEIAIVIKENKIK